MTSKYIGWVKVTALARTYELRRKLRDAVRPSDRELRVLYYSNPEYREKPDEDISSFVGRMKNVLHTW